ncbi:class I SAM-dependent DNA methyltransferase [Mangrovicoccus algicola]|uniref:Methyltransferase n=1 Tax=Mangrovicoccus algicola TaxID=2771008 RepID=A0A8J6Z8V2_9RHOB|nr:methyltransferase domain-containing protein [Mangrovicoccus algicola]MBE3638006.1 methyltransferase [Mangrovicoccus algicola]
MIATRVSSGRPDADRRLEFAEGLAAAGDLHAAAEVLAGALALVPDWAAGWFRLGEWHEAAGDAAAAIAAWDRAVAADPADRFGAGMKRDLMRAVPVTEAVPPAFVEALFDQYAPRFEASLVDQLAYRAPQLLARALPPRRFARAIDLGCGTGLAGEVLRPRCDWLGGWDISAGMLREAAAKGIYDALEKRDLSRLEIDATRYDLILAADVFIYLGALERILAWAAGSLAPGGVLAFTVEKGEAPLTLRDSRRFAHSAAYLRAVLQAAGFAQIGLEEAVLRQDRGADIAGLVVTAASALPVRQDQGDSDDAVPA